jgi:hypothetical protein
MCNGQPKTTGGRINVLKEGQEMLMLGLRGLGFGLRPLPLSIVRVPLWRCWIIFDPQWRCGSVALYYIATIVDYTSIYL